MTTLTVVKRCDYPVTQEWLSKKSNKMQKRISRIINEYGHFQANYKCFSITSYNPKIIRKLLVNSGYLPYIAAKFFGEGFYSISNRGKPLWIRPNNEFAPESFKLGKVNITLSEIEKIELKLAKLRGYSFNEKFRFGGFYPEHTNYPKLKLEEGILNNKNIIFAGDTTNILRVKQLNPHNFEGLENAMLGDIILSLSLPEYNHLSENQKDRINKWNK